MWRPRGEEADRAAEPARRLKLLCSRRKKVETAAGDDSRRKSLPVFFRSTRRQKPRQAEAARARARQIKRRFPPQPTAGGIYPSPPVPLLFAQMTAEETLWMGGIGWNSSVNAARRAERPALAQKTRERTHSHRRTDGHVHAHARTHKRARTRRWKRAPAGAL